MAMAAAAEGAGVSAAQPRAQDEAEEKATAALEAFAQDRAELTDENEADALDALLAPKKPILYDVFVDFETERGPQKLQFVIRGMDGRKLTGIEFQCVDEATGRMDQITADARIIAEATLFLQGKTRNVKLVDDEFLTIQVPDAKNPGEFVPQRFSSPPDALEARFRTQTGLLYGVAREIRRVSGFDPGKVSGARRHEDAAARRAAVEREHARLVAAAGN